MLDEFRGQAKTWYDMMAIFDCCSDVFIVMFDKSAIPNDSWSPMVTQHYCHHLIKEVFHVIQKQWTYFLITWKSL